MLGTLKIAVVTGGNKGIGFEIARKLGKNPNTLCILTSRNEELGERACEELLKDGANVVNCKLDISSEASIQNFQSKMANEYGKIDILVNNAAIAFKGQDQTPFSQQAEPTMRTNFWGTVHVCDALMPLVRNSASGRVVNVCSEAGHLRIIPNAQLRSQFSSPNLSRDELFNLMAAFVAAVEGERHQVEGWPNTCYGMSKLGLIAFTKIQAREELEAGTGVLVNGCCPALQALTLPFCGFGSCALCSKHNFDFSNRDGDKRMP